MEKNLKRRIAIEGLIFLPILLFASLALATGEVGIGFFIIILYAIMRFIIWSVKALEGKDRFKETNAFKFIKNFTWVLISIIIAILVRQPLTKLFHNYPKPVNSSVASQRIEKNINSNPAYIEYYKEIRERIGKVAYNGYNRAETGEIKLVFIIWDDGSVNNISVVENKSSPSLYLRKIAIEAIKTAAPFPAFPKELKYPQLSFEIVLSYEISS